MKKIDFMIDEFMFYCDSKNLSKKTMMSYEQTLRLFSKYKVFFNYLKYQGYYKTS